MTRKIIFLFAAALVYAVLDGYYVFPFLFGDLPLFLGSFIASILAGLEVVSLIYAWQYLDSTPLPNFYDSTRKNRRRFQNLRSDL
jgi:hypothetical protein